VIAEPAEADLEARPLRYNLDAENAAKSIGYVRVGDERWFVRH